jgi:hypothetical protein
MTSVRRAKRQECAMHVSRHWVIASLLSLAGLPAFACYTVYDSTNRVLYQGDKPPVDMSRPLHETLPQRYPDGHLVFDQTADCPVLSPLAMGLGGPMTSTTSPLLTDERTAKSMNVPHKTIDGKVAVVPPADVSMKPGMTVVPAASGASAAAKR